MRGVFWLLFLAAVAVALALLMGDNQAMVTLFWHPYRVDVSLNLVLIGLVVGFVLMHLALRGLSMLRKLPQKAHRWRMHQLERSVHASLLDAFAYQLAGRFVRAQSSAQSALRHLETPEARRVPNHGQLLVMSRLMVAESAQAVGNNGLRDEQLTLATQSIAGDGAEAAREGALLRAARWAVDGHDPVAASRWLGELPQGASRRIQSLRLKLKVAQLQHDTKTALDMVRLLTKHRAFSPQIAASLRRALVQDALRESYDRDQLLRVWASLDTLERTTPELALAVLDRWSALRGGVAQLMSNDLPEDERKALSTCLDTAWNAYASLDGYNRRRVLVLLENTLSVMDASWLARIEEAQRQQPSDAGLQYLAGQAFMQSQLWGKAALLLGQASHGLQDAELLRRTWCSLAVLAAQRGDTVAEQAAWKQAALC